MIKKLNINEGYEDFDETELYFYIRDCIEDALVELESTKLEVQSVENEVPGYDGNWCAESAPIGYEGKKDYVLADLTDLYADLLLANYKTTNE